MTPERLFISFSGGKTSAYMAARLKEDFPDAVVAFANTGQEHEKTLEFVHRCDEYFGLSVVWVEAVVHHGQKKSSTHRVVDYHTACRSGHLFTEMVKKYGISNRSYPHCTRELKINPLNSFIKAQWKSGTYHTAIGIRADEIDRVNPKFEKLRYWYPLANWGVTKADVNRFWERQPFNLEIPEHLGNCTWCWKKSDRKLMAVMDYDPAIFNVPDRIEKENPHAGAGEGPRVFFRQRRSVEDLRKLHKSGGVTPFKDEHFGCKETCEAFS